MNARTWVYSCLCGALLLACGGAAIPQDSLTAAQADVKGAEVGGAADNPQAALHLKLAKDQIEAAQKQIKDGDNEAAARTLDRAQADAELALSLAKEAKAQGDATDATEQVGKLRKEISK
jgi:glycerol-3-phosphate dehydrogenase